MTSYEIGSNSSRYPYDYSFVTDGTNSEYTDTTETSFILPTITGADADKFLQVNAQATGYEYTAVDAELPPQAGQAGKFLETNGSSVFWDTVNQVPGATAGNSGQYLTNNGSVSSWGAISQVPAQTVAGLLRTDGTVASWLAYTGSNSSWLRADGTWQNVRQVPSSGTTNQGRVLYGEGTGSAWSPNLLVSGVTGEFVSCPSTLNLTRAGTAAEPTLLFGDNTATPVASRTGIWGTDNTIRFGTDGVERVTIRNDGLTVPDGSTAAPSYSFENSTNSGLVRTVVGTDNGIGFVANGTQVCSVAGGNFRLSGGASIRNNVSNPSANFQFVGNTGGATGHIQMSFSDSTTGTVATYRLGNGTNWPATETVMSRLVGGTGTNEIFATEHGNTYFRFLGATGTGANLPARVQRVEINNDGMSITGNLSVSGTISGSAPPQVARRVQIVAPDDSNPVIYDSTNPNPPTSVISTSITSNKLVTLGDLGAAYDGFEMEYSLQGVGNTFGVWFTFVAPRGILFPRENRPRISNTVANTSTNAMWGSTGYFNKCVNNFRARATFVWAGGANNCYWIVRDITDYTQRLSTLNLNTGALTISKETARHVLVRRNVATTITFPNLSTVGQNTHDADGFELRIVAYRVASDTPNTVTIENTSGTTMFFITSNTTTEIANNGTQQFVSSTGSAQMDCVYRLDNASNYCWIITKYAG